MRNHYWTIGWFADWLRGTPKLNCGTSKEWRDWEHQARAAHPIRYWLAEEGLDILQRIVFWPTDQLYAIKYYFNNRFISRTHALTAHPRDIKPGEWHDVGNRFLPCLFNELVDFVEVELAWWHLAWSDKAERAKYNAPWWRFGWWNIRVWRCPQAGLDNLAWQMKLTNEEFLDEDQKHLAEPTLQAKNAAEMLALYKWWTEERPKRPDPAEASGWSAYCDNKRSRGNSVWDMLEDDDGDTIDTGPMLEKMREIEETYENEDEEMMIRLIKIRSSLWT